MKGYYFITDSKLSRAGNLSDVMQGGSMRGGSLSSTETRMQKPGQMYEEAVRLREICRDAGSIFLINDRVDIAPCPHRAYGVHLGQSDMPCTAARKLLGREKIIGVTVHNLCRSPWRQNALVPTIWESHRSFRQRQNQMPESRLASDLSKRSGQRLISQLIAIGGISHCNAGEVVRAGADGPFALYHAYVCQRERKG